MAFYAGLMASEAGVVLRLVGRFAADETAKTPPARSSIFAGILDHDLDRRGRTGDRSRPEFGRLNMLPGQFHQNGAVRKWQRTVAVGVDRVFVSKDSTKFV
jgi:hypothetical protein